AHAQHASGTAAAAAHGGMAHGTGARAADHAAADEGTRKLLELADRLVRDPVVQRQIQQDPALREAWSDPDVRRVVTQEP
ncbi:MAG: hypothetical protein KY467_06260, partial [Gemmatimonadetes bacterium]|nr:hypothetical protein [Gemmatimonadota bacterium]